MKRLLALTAAIALLSTAAHADRARSGSNVVMGNVFNSASVRQDAGVAAFNFVAQGDFVSIRAKDPLVVIERGGFYLPYIGDRNKNVVMFNPVDEIETTLIREIEIDIED